AEMHVAAVAESAMQRETFMHLAAVAENGCAVRHASLFIDTRPGMSLVTANFFFAVSSRAFRFVDVLFNVRPCLSPFRCLNTRFGLSRLNVLFGCSFRLLSLGGLLFLFVGRCLRGDRQGTSEPGRY